ncbi:MAG: ABC transporter permease, partial [Planctomycetia bacterium]|nr:ABC transporter permease [Planctomycetia bacterium]
MRGGWQDLRDRALLLAVWLGLVILFGLLTEHFLSLGTFLSVAGRLPALAVVAAGMTLVIVAGGIDLAVGSVAALAAAVLG